MTNKTTIKRSGKPPDNNKASTHTYQIKLEGRKEEINAIVSTIYTLAKLNDCTTREYLSKVVSLHAEKHMEAIKNIKTTIEPHS